ncbi:MAG: hypothetical protein DRJ10_10310 [Bacteroidetes bacterium]|nr:MAG: hypothetical protein DRJ10_10310 [Bacteroidota bacterium]
MKLKSIVISLVFFSTITLSAQKKDIRLNFGFQVNMPERFFNMEIGTFNEKNAGFGFHLMPVWNYTERLSFGINMEYACVTEDYVTDVIDCAHILSFSPTINYYFTNWKIRPFVGFGTGIYHLTYYEPAILFGVHPLVGFSFFDYLNLSLEYNKFFGNLNIKPENEFGNYYVAIKASFSVGVMRSEKQKQEKE